MDVNVVYDECAAFIRLYVFDARFAGQTGINQLAFTQFHLPTSMALAGTILQLGLCLSTNLNMTPVCLCCEVAV